MQKETLLGFLVRAYSKNTKKNQTKSKVEDTLWELSIKARQDEARVDGRLDEWKSKDEPLLVEALNAARALLGKKPAKELKVFCLAVMNS
jgi:hypothetical protein